MDHIEETVKAYLLKEFLPGEDPAELTEATPLVTGGILDSLATLKLVSFLEEHYGVAVQPLEAGDRIVNGVAPKDRDIAMVFQNYALYPHMTVFDNMAFSLKLRHFPKDQIKKRVEEAAGLLNLDQFLKRKPKELSGGQRQRVALGRAIVREPRGQALLTARPRGQRSHLDSSWRSPRERFTGRAPRGSAGAAIAQCVHPERLLRARRRDGAPVRGALA